jgi:hypothetical protein
MVEKIRAPNTRLNLLKPSLVDIQFVSTCWFVCSSHSFEREAWNPVRRQNCVMFFLKTGVHKYFHKEHVSLSTYNIWDYIVSWFCVCVCVRVKGPSLNKVSCNSFDRYCRHLILNIYIIRVLTCFFFKVIFTSSLVCFKANVSYSI